MGRRPKAMRKMGAMLFALCALALVVALCGCGSSGGASGPSDGAAAKPTPPPPSTPCKIAFWRLVGNAGQIFTMNEDGTGVVQLTKGRTAGNNRNPSWSGTGMICFERVPQGGTNQIWVMSADGANPRRVTTVNGGAELWPDWCWGADRIVFARIGGLFVVDHAGSEVQLAAGGPSVWPSFSPDGSQVVYQDNSTSPASLRVVPADGSGQPTLLIGNGYFPDWSPTGDRIAFARGVDLWTISSDGTGESKVNLSPVTGGVYSPSWSPPDTTPGAQQIVLQSPLDASAAKLLKLDAAAGSPVIEVGAGCCPDWSPAVFGG